MNQELCYVILQGLLNNCSEQPFQKVNYKDGNNIGKIYGSHYASIAQGALSGSSEVYIFWIIYIKEIKTFGANTNNMNLNSTIRNIFISIFFILLLIMQRYK